MNMKSKTLIKSLVAATVFAVMGGSFALAQENTSIKGEVVDLMCYLDHGAHGDKHASCAEKCIKSGGPVGILTADKKLYLVIGEHKPMNDELAALAGKTVTLTGKVVSRDGMNMIESAVVSK